MAPDYNLFKSALKRAIAPLDERLLLPRLCPGLQLEVSSSVSHVHLRSRSPPQFVEVPVPAVTIRAASEFVASLPREDVLLLELADVNPASLAQLVLRAVLSECASVRATLVACPRPRQRTPRSGSWASTYRPRCASRAAWARPARRSWRSSVAPRCALRWQRLLLLPHTRIT